MIITVANSREDCGRSMIVINTAVIRALVGRTVLLVDINPAKSTFNWSEERARANIQPVIAARSIKGKQLKEEFSALRDQYNDILIDTDWRASTGNQAALELADLAIVPVAPGEGSIDNLKEMVRRIKIARRTNPNLWTLVVIVGAHDVVPIFELDEIRNYVSKLRFTSLAGTVIRDHPSLQQAFEERLSIFEFKPADHRAIAEMHDLYRTQKMRRVMLPSLARLQRCA